MFIIRSATLHAGLVAFLTNYTFLQYVCHTYLEILLRIDKMDQKREEILWIYTFN